MYTIKFKIGEQWRAFPAKEYFWGSGVLKVTENGCFLEYENIDKKIIDVTRYHINPKEVVDGQKVFYILRFCEYTDVMVFPEHFLVSNDVYIMQDGKTIDRL